MRMIGLFLLSGAAAFAQLDDNTITVTAVAAAPAVQIGQVSVMVTVTAPLTAELDDALKALAGTGITNEDLDSVTAPGSDASCDDPSGSCPEPTTVRGWRFVKSTPVGKLRDTVAALARAAGSGDAAFKISYEFQGFGPAAAAADECAWPSLITQAQRQAQTMAEAAGLRVGRVVGLWDSASAGVLSSAGARAVPSLIRSGNFGPSAMVASVVTAAPPSCAVAVEFQLLR